MNKQSGEEVHLINTLFQGKVTFCFVFFKHFVTFYLMEVRERVKKLLKIGTRA